MLERAARIVPLPLLTVSIAKITQGYQMIRAQLQGVLKIRNGLCSPSLACGDKSQVVPGIGQCVWIVGLQFRCPFKSVSRLVIFLLLKVIDTEDVERICHRGY